MADKKKSPLCYAPLVQKLKEMDTTIEDMKSKIEEIKKTFHREVEEEICPDVLESEMAMLEIMRDVCIGVIADEEPEGEA